MINVTSHVEEDRLSKGASVNAIRISKLRLSHGAHVNVNCHASIVWRLSENILAEIDKVVQTWDHY